MADKYSVVLIPGDGIGPEVSSAVQRVLAAANAPIEWIVRQAGVAALELGEEVLPESTTESIRQHHVALKGIEYNEATIDAGCMKLVQDPGQFDVLLLENLYGDVVSDLCAGLVGGLGVVPGANIGDEDAVFEAVHGSAPDIAGKGVANPLALLMSAAMMLNHLADKQGDANCQAIAENIKAAYNQSLADNKKTRDLGGQLGTDEFADAVIERLGS